MGRGMPISWRATQSKGRLGGCGQCARSPALSRHAATNGRAGTWPSSVAVPMVIACLRKVMRRSNGIAIGFMRSEIAIPDTIQAFAGSGGLSAGRLLAAAKRR